MLFIVLDCGGAHIRQIGKSDPDYGSGEKVVRVNFGDRSTVIRTGWSFVAAAVRPGHVHPTALLMHRAAASPLLGSQLRAREHTGHRGRQT